MAKKCWYMLGQLHILGTPVEKHIYLERCNVSTCKLVMAVMAPANFSYGCDLADELEDDDEPVPDALKARQEVVQLSQRLPYRDPSAIGM